MKKIVKIIISFGLAGWIIWFSIQSLNTKDWQVIEKNLTQINYFYLLCAAILGIIANISRARRWQYVLKNTDKKNGFVHAYHAVMLSYFVNAALPRVGEMSRAVAIHRQENIPIAKAFGTIFAERIIDFLMMGLICLITFLLQINDYQNIMQNLQRHISEFSNTQNTEPNLFKNIIFISIILIFSVFFLTIISKASIRKKVKKKLIDLTLQFYEGLQMTWSIREKKQYIAHTILMWSLYILGLYLPFLALPSTSSISLAGVFSLFVFTILGVLIVPGGVGVVPLITALVIGFYLPLPEGEFLHLDAFVISWLAWLSQTLGTVILGAYSFYRLQNVKMENNLKEISE